jgi:hypothetical protein
MLLGHFIHRLGTEFTLLVEIRQHRTALKHMKSTMYVPEYIDYIKNICI